MEQTVSWPGWETVRLIGRGSFGAVYEIQRTLFGEVEKAALKVITIPQNASDIEELRSDGFDEESITDTFKNHLKSIVSEYSLMRKMNGSANVVNCDDVRYVQHEDGIGWDIYIKMELLTPLTKALPDAIPEGTVIKIASDLCTALELCERFDIVHRDIKPQNIFVSDIGDYKLGDFGIAKTVEKTMGGTKIGTYKYMAPEVYNNQPYGSAADIYSLGLVLYWLLNERRMPFLPLPPTKLSAGMDEAARSRRLSGEPIPAPRHGSEELKRIVLKACAYEPKERYTDAHQMKEALNHLSGTSEEAEEDGAAAKPAFRAAKEVPVRPSKEEAEESEATVVSPVQKTAPEREEKNVPHSAPKKRKGPLIAAACVIVGLLVGGSVFFLGKGSKQPELAVVPTTEVTTEATTEAPTEDETARLDSAYAAAEQLLQDGEYDQAIAAFEALNGYKDSAAQIEIAHQAKAAEELEQESRALWNKVTAPNTISAGVGHTVSLKTDGTVIALGSNTHGRCNVSEWKNIISISAGQYHTVGLKSNGTVVAAGDSRYGACNVGTWKNIIAVSAGAVHTVGLKEDGTVVAVGRNVAGECNVNNWRDIVAISAGDGFTVGLKADGTVVSVGSNNEGQCDTNTWHEIQAISAGESHTIGLKADGTVVATGSNSAGQCNVTGWKNVVAIDAGGGHTIGLRADGKVLSCGASEYKQCNVSSWKNIVAISAGSHHTVGLKADGTVVAVGKNSNGQCDVSSWESIQLPTIAKSSTEANTEAPVQEAPSSPAPDSTEQTITHEHAWMEATCTAPKTCSACGETFGAALGHQWRTATCTTPRVCSVCGETSGSALDHQWAAATCAAPKTCSVCGETSGYALDHQWSEATCTSAQTCQLCGETIGKPLPHSWPDLYQNTTLCKSCGIKRHKMTASKYIGNLDYEKRSESFLWGQSTFRRSDVSSIVFSDAIGNAPTAAWDVSAAGDRSILAWMNGGCLTIACDGIIGANSNSSWLFANFKNLASIDFSDRFDTSSVTNMNAMFAGCVSVPKLDLSTFATSKVNDMGGMFNDCNSLVSVDVSSFDTTNVRHIQWMFGRNYKLSSVDISGFNIAKSTEADCMFYLCKNLSSVTLPDNLTSIGNYAFESCAKLNNVIIPQSVTTIGERAFMYCTILSSINIPDSVTSIGQNAFNGCYKIKSVTINPHCTVGDGAFPSTCKVIRQQQSAPISSETKERNTISAGSFFSLGLRIDGTVVAVGENKFDQCNVSDWKDIVAISAGGNHSVGLKADGTVVAVGRNESDECNVSGWKDIVAVSAGAMHTVGLKSDGTVVAVGRNMSGQCDVNGWKDIVAISAGSMHTVGLKSDGTVVAVGENKLRQCDVSGWKDIVAISAGGNHTVGLKSDGTVVAVGTHGSRQCDVSSWKDIVAISAGGYHTVGLKANGTVVAVGNNEYGQCDVSGWKDIVAISAGSRHTVGLTADGTVVAVGSASNGQRDVAEWKDIKLPCVNDSAQDTSDLYEPGTILRLGRYEQDGNISNGKEEIEWYVIAKDGSRLLLLSRYALEAGKPYNNSYTKVTWENSSIRKWLNGSFYNESFSDEEKRCILCTSVENEDNPYYGTEGGPNTNDSVFLISITELYRYAHPDYFYCEATQYAQGKGAEIFETGNSPWFLRTIGSASDRAIICHPNGTMYGGGTEVNNRGVTIRPSLWVTASAVNELAS